MPYSGGGAGNLAINGPQTPDTYELLTDPLANSILICETADADFDHAHAIATDPTLFIHSRNQSTTQWLGLKHNGTDSVIATGTGGVVIDIGGAGANRVYVTTSELRANNLLTLGFSSAADPQTAVNDAFFTREAAATIQMGADVNGAAVPQTFKSHDGITGTDIAGANFTLAAGRGTGAGASGDLILQAAPALATGTTAQTLSSRVYVVGKAKALTESSATSFVTIGVASGGMVGGTLTYAIRGSDGTDHTCRAGVLPFAIVNKADAEVGTVGTVGTATEVVAVTGGATLTNTFTITTGSNAMSLQANAACSLTQTTLEISYQLHLNGPVTSVTPL